MPGSGCREVGECTEVSGSSGNQHVDNSLCCPFTNQHLTRLREWETRCGFFTRNGLALGGAERPLSAERQGSGAVEGCWQEAQILARGGDVQKSSQEEGPIWTLGGPRTTFQYFYSVCTLSV